MKDKFAIALGNFDGFHIGHLTIVNELFHLSNTQGLIPAIVTFTPNPKIYFKREKQLIFTDSQKKEFMLDMGITGFKFLDFDIISKLTGEEFLKEYLINKYKMSHLVVGYNFKFGKGRDCDINTLKSLSRRLGFELTIIEKIRYAGEEVSSSIIRDKIRKGEIEEANKLLGHEFYIDGKVYQGSKRGKELGFPTINLKTDNTLYPMGVYNTVVRIGENYFKSITNIGYNPTFSIKELSQNKDIKIETHILDFKKTIYDESVRLYFRKKIRDEKKFNSYTELIKQIKEDIKQIQ